MFEECHQPLSSTYAYLLKFEYIMKALRIILFLIAFCVGDLHAQERFTDREQFEHMRQSMRREYDEYRKNIEREYADYLRQTWMEYQLHKGLNPYSSPKPDTIPAVPDDEKRIAKELPAKGAIELPVALPKPEVSPIGKKNMPEGRDLVSVPYYGTTYQFTYNLDDCRLKSTDTNDIADAWEAFSTPSMNQLTADLLSVKLEHRFNDWAFFRLVEETANRIPQLKSSDMRVLFRHFVLFKCGYKLRMGLIDDSLILLVPFYEQIICRPYLAVGDEQYYLFTDYANKVSGAVYTVPLSDKQEGRLFSLRFQEDIHLMDQSTLITKSYREKEYVAHVNMNRIDFFKDYPQCDFQVLAEAPVDPIFEQELFEQLEFQINGLLPVEKLRWLLHFTQSAFQYATDFAQFGEEDYLVPEETFFYPKSDCEDRAIFFSWLVRRILGFEVALLHYDGHLATGVCFEGEIKGSYILSGGKQYLLCDPTYIGADIGQCMPRYENEKPVVIKLNHVDTIYDELNRVEVEL